MRRAGVVPSEDHNCPVSVCECEGAGSHYHYIDVTFPAVHPPVTRKQFSFSSSRLPTYLRKFTRAKEATTPFKSDLQRSNAKRLLPSLHPAIWPHGDVLHAVQSLGMHENIPQMEASCLARINYLLDPDKGL